MKIFRTASSDSRRRGTALALMILSVVVMAGMSTALVCLTLGHDREERGSAQKIHARYVCQAAMSQAMYQMQRGLSGAVGTQANPATFGASRYWVSSTPVMADITQLRATGIDDRTGVSQEIVIREMPTTLWRYGMFGKETLHLDSNAHADSYNSAIGSYASQAVNGSGSNTYANVDGNIGSNGDITLDANAKVWGDATPGPSHTATINDNAVVVGSTTPATAALELPSIPVPTYTSNGNLQVNANTTLPSGNAAYSTLRVKPNKTLTITGPASLVISNLILDSGASLLVNSTGGPVTLYVLDNFIMDSNTTIRPLNNHAADVRVLLLSDNVINPEVTVQLDTIDFASNSSITGVVYAPNARIILDSYFSMYGSLVARSLDVDSNSRFHYDEALLTSTANVTPIFATVCWREIAYQH